MNIKPKLEAEASKLVEEYRSTSGDLHEIIAKHASDRGYGDEVIRSLSRYVNRFAFKQAKVNDGTDEFPIVNAEAVIFRMREPKQASSTVKTASYAPGVMSSSAHVSDGGYNGKSVTVDYGPAFVRKLAARDNELASQIKVAKAEIRSGLVSLAKCAESIKRTGLDKTAGYQQVLGEIPEDHRSIVESVIEASPITKVAFTQQQLRMFIPAALEHTKDMAKIASGVHETSMKLADLQSRRRMVAEQTETFKRGLEV